MGSAPLSSKESGTALPMDEEDHRIRQLAEKRQYSIGAAPQTLVCDVAVA